MFTPGIGDEDEPPDRLSRGIETPDELPDDGSLGISDLTLGMSNSSRTLFTMLGRRLAGDEPGCCPAGGGPGCCLAGGGPGCCLDSSGPGCCPAEGGCRGGKKRLPSGPLMKGILGNSTEPPTDALNKVIPLSIPRGNKILISNDTGHCPKDYFSIPYNGYSIQRIESIEIQLKLDCLIRASKDAANGAIF